MRILLVEPDRLLKDLLVHTFNSDTCEILSASSVAEAEDVSDDQPYDVVIVDANLHDAVRFMLECRAHRSHVLGLVDSDRTRNRLQLAEIPIVDKRDGLDKLIDAVRTASGSEVQLKRPSRNHVLVVDDEEAIRALLSEFLGRKGYDVTVAGDGKEAVEAINRDSTIAVVILDLTMPRMGGLETLAEIMRRQLHPQVIMLTALADRQIAQQAIHLGAFGYILKPPNLNEVENSVSACIALSEM